jgi:GTP-binding protein HflX
LELHRRDLRTDRLSPSGSGVGRAIVLVPFQRSERPQRGAPFRSPAARLEEALGLAAAIDLEVVEAGLVPISAPRPATYIGKGKTEEIAGLTRSLEVGLVVMDCTLSPVQQRNLEKAWNTKVLDRTGLILEIFGRRARTREGALQVEHAHLTYQKSRLVRSWTHLERQRGGFGFLGGPGETQLESDRRVIEERLARIERELEGVKRTRHLHRLSRKRVPYPVAALVGYTNAGKSTLFNRMTQAEVLSADMLFATLDPTLRAVDLPGGMRVILSDTVGFISDLPTMLVAAFRATLEEVIEADVILHVRDITHEDADAQASDVIAVLRQLGIEPDDPRRIVEVWNKIDRLEGERRLQLVNMARRRHPEQQPVLVSALTGEGIEALAHAIAARVAPERLTLRLTLDPADGAGLSWLYRHTEVVERSMEESGHLAVTVRVDAHQSNEVKRRFATTRASHSSPQEERRSGAARRAV